MKKGKIIALVLFGAMIIVGSYGFYENLHGYDRPMKYNWGSTLPRGYECIYTKEGEESIFGDGDRYHVLQYDDEPNFSEKLVWETSCIKSEEIKEILTGLQVESEYIPDLQSSANVKYYHNTKDDDELWMIFNRDQQRLYIIERLI